MNEVEAVKIGDILDDRYELTEIVGRGGCGIVFRATDLNLDREIAVKVLCSDGACTPEMLDRFERESQILRRLHAPNTVFFYDTGRTPQGMPYIAMEFVKGKQLKTLLDETRSVSPETAVSILMQVFQSLSEAHEYGFVHRDLKPANIMLCDRIGFPGYFVKVLDFGVAKIMSEEDPGEPAAKHDNLAGTPRYMAPEQFKNEALTPAADLYSMGCIAYEMLTGIAPFDGDTIHVTVAKHLFMTPQSLGESFDAYPNLEAVIFKLLEKQPENRFASAQEAIDVLEHWQDADLLPQLQDCRLHGDDNAAGALWSDADLPAAAEDGGSGSDDIDAGGGASAETEKAGAENDDALRGKPHPGHAALCGDVPPQKHSKKVFGFVVAFIAVAVITLVGTLFAGFFMSQQDADGESGASDDASGAQGAPDRGADLSKRKLSRNLMNYYVDVMTDELSQSTLIGLGFGALSKREISGLSQEFGAVDGNDAAAAGNGAASPGKDAQNDAKSKRKKKRGKKKAEEAKPSLPPGEIEIFSFIVHYSPPKARVGFLNAMGQCKDGKCQVRSTSTKQRPRVVVSAPGFETQSLVVGAPTTDVRIVLVPED